MQQDIIPPIAEHPDINSVATPVVGSRLGKGFLALTANILIAGLGHWIVGRPRRALFWFTTIYILSFITFITLITPKLVAANIILLPMMAMLDIASYVDSFLCGRRSTKKLASPLWRYVAGLLFLGAVYYAHPSMRLAQYIKESHVETFKVMSGSMSPTLIPGDQFLAHKKSKLNRWDMVVFKHPEYGNSPVPKRIVGLPGETVEIRDSQIHINGQALKSPSGVNQYLSLSHQGRHEPALRDQAEMAAKVIQ